MSGNPPFDRSQDPPNGTLYSKFFWGNYCQENIQGSGWRSSYDLNTYKPRSVGSGGDVIGLEGTYNVDMSFASGGTNSSDISYCSYVWFGYPHNALYGHAIDGNLAEVKKCLESGSNINEKLKIGDEWTALHGAIIYNQLEVVEYLLKQGADYTITDNRGRSSLTVASIFNYTQCVELMKKHVSLEYLENQYQDELKANQKELDKCRSEIIESYGMNY